MITIKELNGATVKKRLGAHRDMFRWHNKNKQGGNFGINIYFAAEYNKETDRELTGNYDKNGGVYSLCYSPLYSAGGRIPIWALESLDTLFNYLARVRAWECGKGVSPEVRQSELLDRREQLKNIGFDIKMESV